MLVFPGASLNEQIYIYAFATSFFVWRTCICNLTCALMPFFSNNRAAVGSLDHNLFISDVGHLRGYSCEHGVFMRLIPHFKFLNQSHVWYLRFWYCLQCGVTCLAWIGKSGQILVTGSKDGKVQLWDLRSQSATVLGAFSCAVSDLSVSCDENFLVCGSIDGTARVFEIANKLHWSNRPLITVWKVMYAVLFLLLMYYMYTVHIFE